MRRLTGRLRIEIRHLENPSQLDEGLYQEAIIPVGAGPGRSDDWMECEIRVEAKNAVFILNNGRRFPGEYSRARPGGVQHPIRLILEAQEGMPGGVELKGFKVQVSDRGEGF
jgi:hypothetical protein